MSTPATEIVEMTLTGQAQDRQGNIVRAEITVNVEVPQAQQRPAGGRSPQQPSA
jgi:hypothetical protein